MAILAIIPASAFEVDGIRYNKLDQEARTVEVTGSSLADVVIPSQVFYAEKSGR